ncbi:MAG: DUF4177 domain-containing protein [Octadecabacter sp.]|nr:DUF4177 domain-containing protein [Octadecabacter sp.]
MQAYEYKVIPAPKKGIKAKGLKKGEARFAKALETVMNEFGAAGWEYQRTDTLPLEERQGLTGKTTSFQNLLVFRRPVAQDATTALSEDQSEAVAPAGMPDNDTTEEAADTQRGKGPAADKRGKDTVASSDFTFPWSSRKARAAKDSDEDKGDDPQVAAE